MSTKLTPRQQKVLWATIRSYIATAEPVGSKELAKKYNLGVSTATIRNDLATLEQGGLLFQPHTSAGRIPSNSGYRVYVDELLFPSENLQQEVWQTISQQLNQTLDTDVTSLLRRATRILAQLSGCIALITAPQNQLVVIRHLQLVLVDPQKIMVILVTDAYQTHSVLVNLGDMNSDPTEELIPTPPVSPENLEPELQLLSNFLNFKLRGKTFSELQDLSWLSLDQEFRSFTVWIQQLFLLVGRRCLQPVLGEIYMAGVTELMRQPEFSQSQHVQSVVQLLEENKDELGQVLNPCYPGQVMVYIGTENPLEPIQHCTLLVGSYYRGESPMGNVSLLGPTRMLYETAIASVQLVASYLSDALATPFLN